ncbi:hypothetical protein [Xenorhabdus entomophaga]|uniref:hypothetical protein n=1 Tax=Xenorhabdus entomophaga TaxID=3136257 RepID=UPI0030F3F012
MKKELTEFEKIAGYLSVLEEQQEVITGLLTAAGENQGTVADIIMRFESAISLAIGELKQKLAELDHIEAQKAHMNQVLSELNDIKRSAVNSLDTSAAQFRELAKTVPVEIKQNILATIQQTDIAGAVRQRTDAQMEAIATQVDTMTQRGRGFVDKIASAERDLTSRYDQLKKNLWKIVGGTMLSTALVTTLVVGLSAKFFFSAGVDRNYSAIYSTYQLVEQLKTQCHTPTGKLEPVPNNSGNLKKK